MLPLSQHPGVLYCTDVNSTPRSLASSPTPSNYMAMAVFLMAIMRSLCAACLSGCRCCWREFFGGKYLYRALVVVTAVVGFSRTDDGYNHRQGATPALSGCCFYGCFSVIEEQYASLSLFAVFLRFDESATGEMSIPDMC